MFQIYVPNQKIQGKNQLDIFETFLNAVIRNIKIQNILDINEISNSMKQFI